MTEQVGRKVKELEDQHPVRKHWILEVNRWLKGWCCNKNFGFLDHGLHYLQEGLLAGNEAISHKNKEQYVWKTIV